MANILYKKLKRQYTDNGVSWIDMNVYKVGDVLEDPSNCQSENTKVCRWVELDLSEGYTCVGYSKYTLEVEECSTDGIVWTRTGNQREGVLVESGSADCGYTGNTSGDTGTTEECRWVELDLSEDYTCVGYSKYTLEVEECSTDGINWTRTGNQREGVLVESNSVDCGYSGNTGNTGTTTEGNLIFEFSGDSLVYKLNGKSYTAYTSPYSTTLQELGIDNLTNCGSTFGATKLTNLIEFPDTSNVTRMPSMFASCTSLTSLDLSNFDTSNVTTMYRMFASCTSLTSLDVSNFDTSNVTDMYGMFDICRSLTSLDVSSFNTSNVTNMGKMFEKCSGLTSLDLSNFDTSNVIYMDEMFNECNSLTSLDLSNFDTSAVTTMAYMFDNCSGLTSLDVSSFNTSNVTYMPQMFLGCTSLTSLDVSSFNTSNVINMDEMFYNCYSLTSLDLSNFDTSNVIDMRYMFAHCTNLTSLNLSNWNISKVTTMEGMFKNCTNLTSVTVANCSGTTKQFILDRLNTYFTATLSGDIITVTH